jgi:hypothetical protein
VTRSQLLIALSVVALVASVAVGCQQLPEWPDFAQTGLGGSGAAGTSPGAAGMTATAGSTGAAGSSSGAGSSGAGTAGAGAAGMSTVGSGGMGGGGGSTSGSGGAGGAAAGTTGGMAGATAMSDPLAEAKLALANLDNFTWTKPCKFSDNGKDVTVLSGCQAADICWETSDLGRTFEAKTIEIKGVAGHTYQFDLRLRGVLEPRDYPVAPNCARLPNMPADTIGVSACQDGYANKSQVTFNVMELAIPTPAKKYYFNSVNVHPPHRVDKADWKWTVTVAANQTLKFTFDDLNGGMIRNCTSAIPGADVAVKMQPFNGQWFQLNVDFGTLVVH